MVPIARANRAVALDLPGFGASDKPVGIRYSFDFFGRALDLFLAHASLDRFGLVVHDLGGPVGLHWTLGHPGRVTKLALLNTLVYPEFSNAVKEFVRAAIGRLPWQPISSGWSTSRTTASVAVSSSSRPPPGQYMRRAR
jgi:pimeloyl-ACP methyl ester carboxylesterase